MRHDRPTFPNDLPPPWAVMLPDARMETLSDASKRLSVRADRLRERALDLGYWDGVVREGQTITQRADAWTAWRPTTVSQDRSATCTTGGRSRPVRAPRARRCAFG